MSLVSVNCFKFLKKFLLSIFVGKSASGRNVCQRVIKILRSDLITYNSIVNFVFVILPVKKIHEKRCISGISFVFCTCYSSFSGGDVGILNNSYVCLFWAAQVFIWIVLPLLYIQLINFQKNLIIDTISPHSWQIPQPSFVWR